MRIKQGVDTRAHHPSGFGGGKLQRKLICDECKRQDTDQDLCDQFKTLAAMLNTVRDRGRHSPLKGVDSRTSIKYVVGPDGPVRTKPDFCNHIAECGEYDIIGARSREDAERHLANIKRKGIGDFSKATTVYSVEWEDIKLLQAQYVGGKKTFRAVAKSAYCFLASVVGVTDILMAEYFDAIRGFVYKDTEPDLANWGFEHSWFFDGIWVGEWTPAHAIAVHFNSAGDGIIAYVQLFGAFRFAVLLSECDPWKGKYADQIYILDPISGKHDRWELTLRLPDVPHDILLRGAKPVGDDLVNLNRLAAKATADISKRYGGGEGGASGVVILPQTGGGAL